MCRGTGRCQRRGGRAVLCLVNPPETVSNPGEPDASGDARIVRSIPLLDEAALEAVRKWEFEPTPVDGQAVPVRMNVTVNFTLPLPRQSNPVRQR